MKFCRLFVFLLSALVPSYGQQIAPHVCSRPVPGSVVVEPADLRSKDGVLKVELNYYEVIDANSQTRFCFQTEDGAQSPNIRVRPGDKLILVLTNKIQEAVPPTTPHAMHASIDGAVPCTSGPMTPTSTNIHFHGLEIAPTCHQDDTLMTSIQPSDPPFEYKFTIPLDQPPGLYWYHPHIHGFTRAHALGGASGALIVEGVEGINPSVRGLPERVFVFRDQELINPDAEPIWTGRGPAPAVIKDADGDVINTGTGAGKPAKDLSINFVPVPFPNYTPAVIEMRTGEKQYWRVLNASAITYVDLRLTFDNIPQRVELVAIDGIPLNYEHPEESTSVVKDHILLPPGARAEFVVTAPRVGVKALLVTRSVDTGRVGDNAPLRTIATIRASESTAQPRMLLDVAPSKRSVSGHVPLARVKPVRQRLLYFSERPANPKDRSSPTMFFVTVDGQPPQQFDPTSALPNITVHAGDVEDWIIENRSLELHAFHIHQTHFQLLEWNGIPVSEPFLYDTINVPYWREKMTSFPSIKIRMDFRNPGIVGTFAYHCHLLEHQDGGMMGLIQVLPAPSKATEGESQEGPSHRIGQQR